MSSWNWLSQERLPLRASAFGQLLLCMYSILVESVPRAFGLGFSYSFPVAHGFHGESPAQNYVKKLTMLIAKILPNYDFVATPKVHILKF